MDQIIIIISCNFFGTLSLNSDEATDQSIAVSFTSHILREPDLYFFIDQRDFPNKDRVTWIRACAVV